VLRVIGIAVTVLLVSTVGVVGYAYFSVTRQIDEAAVDIGGTPPPPPPLLGAIEGGFSMLVVGTDWDEKQGDQYGERTAALNDVNILLHVSADHQNAVVVSFPRDLVIAQPACDAAEATDAEPLNAAWERGGENGLGCVVAAVRDLSGLDIPYAAATSFNGVIEMTNAVGGVEVCLTGPISDTDSGLNLSEGFHTVAGAEALAFLRNRKGVGDGSDLSRIGSQQQYLSSLLRTIRGASTLSDPTKVYGLAQAVASNIVPSTTVSTPDTLVSLALALRDIDLAKVVFVSFPVSEYVGDPNKVQPIDDLAAQLFERIRTDQPFTLDPGSTPTGSTVQPGTGAAPAGPAAPVDPAAPDAGADPSATDAAGTPDVIEGLQGQTAAEQTCANPS
jgi:LCP family protein required for cell wall assembly